MRNNFYSILVIPHSVVYTQQWLEIFWSLEWNVNYTGFIIICALYKIFFDGKSNWKFF